MEINLSENKHRFIELLRAKVQREGVNKLIAWLDREDFFTAPASTQYHLAVEGGLCQHSLNVYTEMMEMANLYYPANAQGVRNGVDMESPTAFDDETIAIVSLLHDICKVACYKKGTRNVKNEQTGRWEAIEVWKWDEQFKFGHGAKSVFIIQQFMRLNMLEAQAIRYHMAGKDDALSDSYDRQYAEVFDINPVAVLVALADTAATFLTERRGI